MLSFKIKITSFLLMIMVSTVACSKEGDDKNNTNKVTDTGVTKVEVTKKVTSSGVKAKAEVVKKKPVAKVAEQKDKKKVAESFPESAKGFDIMKMLPPTDICFDSVEFFRDEGDVAMYKAFGKKIKLEGAQKLDHSHKTYIGIVAEMISVDNYKIPDIRMKLLDTCRTLTKVK